MRAWRVHALGAPQDVLRLDEVPDPEPGPGEVLVRVDATALNFPDALLCAGLYQVKPPLPFTPGLEVAGTVVAAGAGAEFAVGDRVLGGPGLPAGGAPVTGLRVPKGVDVTRTPWIERGTVKHETTFEHCSISATVRGAEAMPRA